MATLTVQDLPRNGQGFGGLAGSGLTFVAADVAGDEYVATGKELVLIKGGSAWVDDYAQVEGVLDASGRDGTGIIDPGAIDNVDMGGPFRPRDWNVGGIVQITYPSGVTGVEVAIVRFTTG